MIKRNERSKLQATYHGETHQNLRSGFGVYRYSNPFFRYEGTWKKGKKHGYGKLLMNDGSYYQGEFSDGEIIGQGTRYFATTRNTYVGHFYYGEMDGHGRLRYGNGDCFEGEFKCNKREGEGSFLSSKKELYNGVWHDNLRHGQGIQTYSDNSKYDGDWLADKRHGHGKLTRPDGFVYEGQWRNDLFHGTGVSTQLDGYIYRGLFMNGLPSGWPFRLTTKDTENVSLKSITFNENEEPLTITIIIVDLSNRILKSENGRLIRLRCGKQCKEATVDSIPTPFGYHVDIVEKQNNNDMQDHENSTVGETNDSILAVEQNGQAVFTGLYLNTFFVPKVKESSLNTDESVDAGADSRRQSPTDQPELDTAKYVFLIDDITNPVPYGKAIEILYLPISSFSIRKTKPRKFISRSPIKLPAEEFARLQYTNIDARIGNQKLGYNTELGEWQSEGTVGTSSREVVKLEKQKRDLEEENNILKVKIEVLLDMLAEITAEGSLQKQAA
ncbi:unnamed protein product [Didymodactylos carnosus]|uniref:MORN repeat-containing protein 1 n=3 Tax=Didymodactylos carnosus TaxID=1234261 RepID=A0A813W379_9BILA|nr:unnamed protein product [Didymodactylos carnosus]CAF3639345.1 unnamed protein product [Didymodactylos carnosus]